MFHLGASLSMLCGGLVSLGHSELSNRVDVEVSYPALECFNLLSSEHMTLIPDEFHLQHLLTLYSHFW